MQFAFLSERAALLSERDNGSYTPKNFKINLEFLNFFGIRKNEQNLI